MRMYNPVGMAQESPTGIVVEEYGGRVMLTRVVRSKPIEPGVTMDGSVVFECSCLD